LYPLPPEDNKGHLRTWDTFSLAILNDYKGAGELFIKCFADLIVLGEEIGNLVIKDIDFFGSLFSYVSFPELLDALEGQQEMVEVYKSKIASSGKTFLSKSPFLTNELIKRKIGV